MENSLTCARPPRPLGPPFSSFRGFFLLPLAPPPEALLVEGPDSPPAPPLSPPSSARSLAVRIPGSSCGEHPTMLGAHFRAGEGLEHP